MEIPLHMTSQHLKLPCIPFIIDCRNLPSTYFYILVWDLFTPPFFLNHSFPQISLSNAIWTCFLSKINMKLMINLQNYLKRSCDLSVEVYLISNIFMLLKYCIYNWLIWCVLKLAFFSKKYFPCIYFGVCNSQDNAIYM